MRTGVKMISRLISFALSIFFPLVVLSVPWQLHRYHEARRDIVHDQQALFYSPDAFHVATLLNLGVSQNLLERVGPMHMGTPVTPEGDAKFDQIAIVYYPGVEFFAEMVQSTFYTDVSGGRQLGDTQASPTVPLLPHL